MRSHAQRYKKLKVLGGGSYGEVWVAIDTVTNQKVAIKIQEAENSSSAKELMVYSLLSSYPHQNVAVLLDFFMAPKQGGSKLYLNTIHKADFPEINRNLSDSRGLLCGRSMRV